MVDVVGWLWLADCRCARRGSVASDSCVHISTHGPTQTETNTPERHRLNRLTPLVQQKQCHTQLNKKYPEVKSLRGVSMEKLDSVKGSISDVVYRSVCVCALAFVQL